MNKSIKKPVAIALGTAFVVSATMGTAQAAVNPFVAELVPSAYELTGARGDGDGEGNCGEGNCGEGNCGEGNCGESGGEHSCGEGRCGG